MAFTPGTEWSNKAATSGIDPIVLVEIAGDTDWYFCTRALESGAGVGYDSYEPLIADISNIEHEARPERYGMALRSDVSVTLQNTDTDLVAAIWTTGLTSNSLEEKAIIFKVGFRTQSDGDPFLLTDFVTVFEGKIQDFDWNEKTLKIKAYDPLNNRQVSFPLRRFDDTYCHDDVEGEWEPILYGNATHALGLQMGTLRGAQAFKFNSGGASIPCADQDPDQIDLWVWDKSANIWLPVAHMDDQGNTGGEEYQFIESGGYISFSALSNPYAWEGFCLFVYDLAGVDTFDSGGVTNPDNVWDGSTVTYATMTLGTSNPEITGHTFWPALLGSPGYNAYGFVAVELEDFQQRDGLLCHAYARVKWNTLPTIYFTTGGSVRYCFVQILPGGKSAFFWGGYVHDAQYVPEAFRMPSNTNYDNIGGADDITDYDLAPALRGGPLPEESNDQLKTTRWGVSGNGLDAIRGSLLVAGAFYQAATNIGFTTYPYELGLLVSARISFQEIPRMTATMLGRKYNSTWNSRKTSANAITRGIDVVEGWMRHELGLVTADIDESAFDAVYTELGSDFEGVTSVYDLINWEDLLNQMCEGLAVRSFKRYDGRESVFVIPSTVPASDFDFDTDDIIAGSLKMSRTPLDEAYNEWVCYYGWEPIAERWTGERSVNSSDNNWTNLTTEAAAAEALCSDSETRLGAVRRKVIENRFVDNSDHAEALLDRLINTERRTHRHWVAEFRVSWDTGFGVELFDQISINHPLIPTSVSGPGGGSGDPYIGWEVVKVSYDLLRAEVEITAVSFDADEGP